GIVLAGNQLFVRGTVDLLMYTSFRCTTASDSWLEYFLSNNLLINTLCYVSFVSYGFAKHTIHKEKSSIVQNNKLHFTEKIAVKEGNCLIYIDIDSIKWIEADNNCIVFHTTYKKIVSYQTLKSVEAILDPRVFVRIHRSTIINRFLVKSITNLSTGGGLLQTTDDVQLRVSRTYKKDLQDLLSSQ
ncbi:MAG: LytTR family DNA-binding domain-containing protein, partial [Bacteroidota bacterium]